MKIITRVAAKLKLSIDVVRVRTTISYKQANANTVFLLISARLK